MHGSARGEIARAALKETLVTMGAQFVCDEIVDATDNAALRAAITTILSGAARVRAQAQNQL